MKTAIYQYWDGAPTTGNTSGSKAMKKYAYAIGADYIYEDNPRFITNLGQYSPHYGAFKPVFDDIFKQYDYVLFADTDVFPIDNLQINIFDQFLKEPDIEIGICEEWQQPEMRKRFPGDIDNRNDEKWVSLIENTWNVKMPRTDNGLPRVFNSGVVVYSRQGFDKARKSFVDFHKYVNTILTNGIPSFYTGDQNYLHAMLQVCGFKWKIMDYKWNSSVHLMPGTSGSNRPVNDLRNDPYFVHIQLRGADHFDEETLYRITNKPLNEWNFR